MISIRGSYYSSSFGFQCFPFVVFSMHSPFSTPVPPGCVVGKLHLLSAPSRQELTGRRNRRGLGIRKTLR